MASIIIVGKGIVTGWIGTHWAIDTGMATVFILPSDMKAQNPVRGMEGVLTYESGGSAAIGLKRNCFRSSDDPLLQPPQ